MRILHTLAPARVGGLEEVVFRLSAGLQRRGHDVTVASVREEAQTDGMDAGLREAGVRVETILAPGRRYLHEVSQLRELCRTLRPDVFHTHGYRPDVIHPFAANAFGIPLVSTLHGFTGGGWRNRFYEWLQRRSVSAFDAVVAVSRVMAGHLRDQGVPERALRVIPNAWAPREDLLVPEIARKRLGVEPDRFHVGWVGRLSHEKAPDVLLAAVSRSSGPLKDSVVSFVGDGPLRSELEAAARTSRMDVRCHGLIPGAAQLLGGFDLMVLSSRTEGTPIVLFEAMAAGVPVVATAVGGVPDVLDSRTAILVPPDDPEALREAIERVRREPGSARARAQRARRVLETRFALDPWLDRYLGVYAAVARPGSTSRLAR